MVKAKKKKSVKCKVKLYPFSEREGLYTPTESDIKIIRLRVSKWNPKEPKYHILLDILKQQGYTKEEYKKMTFTDVVELFRRWWQNGLRRAMSQAKKKLSDKVKLLKKTTGGPGTNKQPISLEDYVLQNTEFGHNENMDSIKKAFQRLRESNSIENFPTPTIKGSGRRADKYRPKDLDRVFMQDGGEKLPLLKK